MADCAYCRAPLGAFDRHHYAHADTRECLANMHKAADVLRARVADLEAQLAAANAELAELRPPTCSACGSPRGPNGCDHCRAWGGA